MARERIKKALYKGIIIQGFSYGVIFDYVYLNHIPSFPSLIELLNFRIPSHSAYALAMLIVFENVDINIL